jgi:RES domain-containing protein
VDVAALLERVPTRRMQRRLVRCVAALDFMEGARPSFLYTSGSPNRCNPRGVDCLYFSEMERVATMEYRRLFVGTSGVTAPRLTFVAAVDLVHVVDLAKRDVRSLLQLSAEDLFGSWRNADPPTRLQSLGLAISKQQVVTAIRYPSAACRIAGEKGWNVAIFPEAVQAPSRVRILGPSGDALEELT